MDLFILFCASMRVLIGLAPILAPGPSSRLFGFPEEHDNATARLMGRLFGVRDIGLGVLAAAAVAGTVPYSFALLFNAFTDLGDALAISVPLIRREGIDRGASISLVFAILGGSTWTGLYLLL